MKRLRMFLAPLALLLAGSMAAGGIGTAMAGGKSDLALPHAVSMPGRRPVDWRMPVWRQVRIEQRFSIRISPGTATMPPAVVEHLEEEERVERVEERKIGKCLGINAIAAVQPGDGDELLLFLHDQRVIRVTLEKHCSARSFYSGFYIAGNADGAICAGRDILQSRSGTNCKVRRLNELVPARYRRFP